MPIPNWRCQECGDDYDGCTCALANKQKGSEVNKQYPLVDRLSLRKYICAEYGNDIFVSADDLERLLEKGLVRYSFGGRAQWYLSPDECERIAPDDPVAGLVIGICPLKPKTKQAQLIEDLANFSDDLGGLSELIKQAKALVEGDVE